MHLNTNDGPIQRSLKAELLTAKDVADLLNISERSLYRLKSRGCLPASVVLGGSVRWSRTQIFDWIAEGCPPLLSQTKSAAEQRP